MLRVYLRAFVFLCLIGVFCSGTPALGQATDASIRGTVSDENGDPLIGVNVIIENESTGYRTGTITDTDGAFTFRQLPIGGPYNIKATYVGFQSQRRTDVMLSLGSTIDVDLTLAESSVELDEVVVQGFDFDARADRLGSTSTLFSEQIEALPTADRDFLNLASLTPLFGRGLNLSGQRRMSTNLTIDGMNARDQFKGGGISSGPFTISMEAINEFEVVTNNYDVTIGRQGGGGINVATKSGTNTWTGSAFTYHRSDQLRNSEDFRGRELEEFNTTQWGFSLGGPIQRDKLHFFVAFDRQDESLPLFVSNVETEEDELNFGITRNNLEEVVSILRDQYGTSTEQPQFGTFDRQTVANTLYSRLDWQMNDTHQIGRASCRERV